MIEKYMYVLETLKEVFLTVMGWGWVIVKALGSYLGMGEGIAKDVISLVIIAFLATAPFPVSRKDKREVRNAVSVVVDVLSGIRG